MRGGARALETPVTPAGFSSDAVEPTPLEDEEADEIDLHGGMILPEGISSSVVVQGPTKT